MAFNHFLSMSFTRERTSSTAYLSLDDSVIQCIRSRSSEFQGCVDLVASDAVAGGAAVHESLRLGSQSRREESDDEQGDHALGRPRCGVRQLRDMVPKVSVGWGVEDQRGCDLVDCEVQTELDRINFPSI
ncbi:2OG-Fe(II)oxygenase [Colletotrichum orchidophilum]|uniref:2OG-Fe(II)oxygenase n=1 Tax=Colletotrichum orchidophilum TaxID=1209926 RepID=A0A1G4AQ37_9PEZI|nr:2OG-Fe(II)oxygenase [Colletotrichum orchidophilum]OHE91211.1 2OG-Fe(II)oxygenase [Colletotrichum orchidophilum]